MSRTIFADTFYWIALAKPTDPAHAGACSLRESMTDASLLTTDEVLVEYLAYFSATPAHVRLRVALSVRSILNDPVIDVVPQDRETFLAGLDYFQARLDKHYSLTDCIAMLTMRKRGVTAVLTNDRHFAQEGFRLLFDGGPG
ncbi:MAG TPA: nucleic acid-binding protein [Acidobacteriota bacterium]|nr:nucleic acid-binding protein [Acidobacteriota bacterium]